MTSPAAPAPATPVASPDAGPLLARRYVALDVFRGLTIAGMILVNTPGSWAHVYAPLRHAAWHGATPTDLIFPFFLFIVGVAMWFSFSKFEHRPSPDVLKKTARRVVLLFAVGLLILNAHPYVRDYGTLRIMGVLQRIALAYGLASLLCLSLRPKALLATSAGLLLGYWALLWAGGGPDPYALETNLARQIDLFVFGADHLYKGFGVPFDPEGLLATIPAAVTVVLGYLAGRTLRSTLPLEKALLHLFLAGTALLLAGVAWHPLFPINKPLWTSSYVLYTGGIAMLGLAWAVWLIDVKGWRRWAEPFRWMGLNPLFLYVLSGLWVLALIRWVRLPAGDGTTMNGYAWLYQKVFVPLAGPLNGSLLFALAHVAAFILLGRVLYRRRLFIKL